MEHSKRRLVDAKHVRLRALLSVIDTTPATIMSGARALRAIRRVGEAQGKGFICWRFIHEVRRSPAALPQA